MDRRNFITLGASALFASCARQSEKTPGFMVGSEKFIVSGKGVLREPAIPEVSHSYDIDYDFNSRTITHHDLQYGEKQHPFSQENLDLYRNLAIAAVKYIDSKDLRDAWAEYRAPFQKYVDDTAPAISAAPTPPAH